MISTWLHIYFEGVHSGRLPSFSIMDPLIKYHLIICTPLIHLASRMDLIISSHLIICLTLDQLASTTVNSHLIICPSLNHLASTTDPFISCHLTICPTLSHLASTTDRLIQCYLIIRPILNNHLASTTDPLIDTSPHCITCTNINHPSNFLRTLISRERLGMQAIPTHMSSIHKCQLKYNGKLF